MSGIELNGIWVRKLPGPMHLGLRTGPLCPMFCTKLEELCSFSKVPDGLWCPQGPKRRNPDGFVSVKTIPHTRKTWTEVSSSVPHFLKIGLLLSPIIYKCLLKVLCPVRMPITTLDCVVLEDNNRTLVARSGPEINSPACLCVLQGPRHNTKCWFSIQHFILFYILPRDALRKGRVQQTVAQNQWRTQEFCSRGGERSTNSVEDRENGDLGVVAP